jgi:hypothetical protein
MRTLLLANVHVATNFRAGILGHQSNKRLESFAPCHSQSLLLADLKETMLNSGFKDPHTKIRETKTLASIHE